MAENIIKCSCIYCTTSSDTVYANMDEERPNYTVSQLELVNALMSFCFSTAASCHPAVTARWRSGHRRGQKSPPSTVTPSVLTTPPCWSACPRKPWWMRVGIHSWYCKLFPLFVCICKESLDKYWSYRILWSLTFKVKGQRLELHFFTLKLLNFWQYRNRRIFI